MEDKTIYSANEKFKLYRLFCDIDYIKSSEWSISEIIENDNNYIIDINLYDKNIEINNIYRGYNLNLNIKKIADGIYEFWSDFSIEMIKKLFKEHNITEIQISKKNIFKRMRFKIIEFPNKYIEKKYYKYIIQKIDKNKYFISYDDYILIKEELESDLNDWINI